MASAIRRPIVCFEALECAVILVRSSNGPVTRSMAPTSGTEPKAFSNVSLNIKNIRPIRAVGREPTKIPRMRRR
jgi:hypothetical protein